MKEVQKDTKLIFQNLTRGFSRIKIEYAIPHPAMYNVQFFKARNHNRHEQHGDKNVTFICFVWDSHWFEIPAFFQKMAVKMQKVTFSPLWFIPFVWVIPFVQKCFVLSLKQIMSLSALVWIVIYRIIMIFATTALTNRSQGSGIIKYYQQMNL